jgi:hypothetical protein
MYAKIRTDGKDEFFNIMVAVVSTLPGTPRLGNAGV